MGYPPVNEQSANWYRWHIYIRTFTSMIYHDLPITNIDLNSETYGDFPKRGARLTGVLVGIKTMVHPLTDSASTQGQPSDP